MKKSIAYLVFAGSLALGLGMADTVTQDTVQNKKTEHKVQNQKAEQMVQAPDFRTIEQPLDKAVGPSPKSDWPSRKHPVAPVILVAPGGGSSGGPSGSGSGGRALDLPDWLQALLRWLPV
jgi:hypothetical protein